VSEENWMSDEAMARTKERERQYARGTAGELTRLRSVEQAARVILQCFDDSCEASCVASDAEIEALRLALDSK
jgi:hypothetical protein